MKKIKLLLVSTSILFVAPVTCLAGTCENVGNAAGKVAQVYTTSQTAQAGMKPEEAVKAGEAAAKSTNEAVTKICKEVTGQETKK